MGKSGPFFFALILSPVPGYEPRKGAEMREEKLLNYLKGACTGRKYRASSAELEAVLGISGTDLRKLVNRMRRKGIPIGSDRWGYFYATTAVMPLEQLYPLGWRQRQIAMDHQQDGSISLQAVHRCLRRQRYGHYEPSYPAWMHGGLQRFQWKPHKPVLLRKKPHSCAVGRVGLLAIEHTGRLQCPL